MAQFTQRFRFDLSNALACDVEILAHLFQRSLVTAVVETKPQPNDSLFTGTQRLQHVAGLSLDLSSIRSPSCESPFSPIGVSSEIGSCISLRAFRTLSTDVSIFFAISSVVGSRPSSRTNSREVFLSLFITSIMCTGMRIVRA